MKQQNDTSEVLMNQKTINKVNGFTLPHPSDKCIDA